MNNSKTFLSSMLIFTSLISATANALIIREYLGGGLTTAPGLFLGTSVTTGTGTGWNNLEMSFYTNYATPTPLPIAYGNLYLFGTQYTGTPLGLAGIETAIDIGVSNGTQWLFDPATIILSDMTYYFYTDTVGSALGGLSDTGVTGEGILYSSFPDGNFEGPVFGLNFTLKGKSVNSVPVPNALALFSLGLAGLGWSRRKKA